MTDRAALALEFLQTHGWADAQRWPLAGDASDRSYQRLALGDRRAVLMDAPPGKGDDPADFVRIAEFLGRLGLSPPAILARDLPHGFLLLEDLGDDLFARLIEQDPAREAPLCQAAADVLICLHQAAPPPGLPDLTAADWAEAAMFCVDFYRHALTGDHAGRDALRAEMEHMLTAHADGPRVVILRDYHAENLLWLPDRDGVRRVGLLDFQLAQMGQPGYDLVSLLQDARRDVSEATEAATIRHFLERTGRSEQTFSAAYAALGAQRALRIIGIFARLCLVGGKDRYLAFLPRVWSQLQRNLGHPALSNLARIVNETLPAPDAGVIERIRLQCRRT